MPVWPLMFDHHNVKELPIISHTFTPANIYGSTDPWHFYLYRAEKTEVLSEDLLQVSLCVCVCVSK